VWCDNDGAKLEHYYADGTKADEYNQLDAANLAFNNVNPGDYMTIDACITNDGNKSAWVVPALSVTISNNADGGVIGLGDLARGLTIGSGESRTTIADILEAQKTSGLSAYNIYVGMLLGNDGSGGVATQQNILKMLYGTAQGKQITAEYGTFSITQKPGTNTTTYALLGVARILNGTGAFAEVESGAIVDNQINLSGYEIGLASTAGNIFQGRTVDLNIEIKALQYRNNPNPVWTDAVDYNAE
jgi:hypothetical protein